MKFDDLIFVLIFVVVAVVKIAQSMSQQKKESERRRQAQGAPSDGEWQAWESLLQGQPTTTRGRDAVPSAPPVTPAAVPAPGRAAAVPPPLHEHPVVRPPTPPAVVGATAKHSGGPQAIPGLALAGAAPAVSSGTLKTGGQLKDESLALAFAASSVIEQPGQTRGRRVVTIRLKGREDLRRAVLYSEILGRPRAFDI